MSVRNNKSTVYFLLGGLVTGLLLGALIYFGGQNGGEFWQNLGGGDVRTAQVGKPAPDFTLTDLDGETVRLADLQGKAVMLNFWATWCGPCRLEMPLIERRAESYPDELIILGINAGESESAVREYLENITITFPILIDTDLSIQQQYLVRGLPTTFIIDPAGVVQVQHIGLVSAKQLDEYLRMAGVGE